MGQRHGGGAVNRIRGVVSINAADLELTVQRGVDEQLRRLRAAHGGFGGGGTAWRPYHNGDHAAEVAAAAELLADDLGLGSLERLLLQFAATWHDDAAASGDEALSARDAMGWLAAHTGVDEDLAERIVAEPIRGTRWDPVARRQDADPDDVYQAALADADSAGWGMPGGERRWLLRTMEEATGPRLPGVAHWGQLVDQEPPGDVVLESLHAGVRWLRDREYLTAAARKRWQSRRRRNGERLHELLAAYERGTFWDVVRAEWSGGPL